jgi:DNA-binding PadR family transcriptional regulator
MSAKIAVLGLVIEEPSPPHRLTAKLRQRLSSAEFVDSNVYSALTRLEREGLVRADETDGGYEATEEGVRHFEQWLFASSSAPPLRDELHMKIALCQPQNLPRMIELVYGQEVVCLARVQELKRSFEKLQAPEPHRWSGLVMVLVRDAELAFWEARLSWLQGVRDSLEHMGTAYEGGAAGRQAGWPERGLAPEARVSRLRSGPSLSRSKDASRRRREA